MKIDVNDLIEKFYKIKNSGWHKSIRSGSTGIGMTFECLLGINENNFEIPDYNGIEIKTKRNFSKSYITLFNCKPDGPCLQEIQRLQLKYGYPDKDFKEYKVINNSIFCNRRTWIGTKYQFMIKIDRSQEKIFLLIFDVHGNLIEKNVYWDFSTIKEKLYRKVKIIAYITASRKFINGTEYFKYNTITIYKLKDFESFINAIENRQIKITFKIGIFKSGIRKGETHDHGTGFDIKKEELLELYDIYSA